MDLQLLGRDRELAELARLRSAAGAVGGAFVLLCGEAGIGKTTVLTSFVRWTAREMPALIGRCVVDEGAPAFWPVLRILEQGTDLGLSPGLLDMGDGPPAPARFLAIERTVRALISAAEPVGLVVALDDLHWAR